MSNDRAPETAQELMDALWAFVEDPKDEVQHMGRDEVRRYLQDEGIDIDARTRQLRERLKKIRGQEELADAGERLRQIEQSSAEQPALQTRMENVVETFKREFALLTRPQQAAAPSLAFRHRAEGETSEADLERMLDDLRVLRELRGESGDEDRAEHPEGS